MPERLLDLHAVAPTLPPPSLDVLAAVEIEAEVRRVLQALAVPEYMEAWIRIPEFERIECHPDGRTFDRFRIDLFSNGSRQGTIHGSCLLSKPNRVTYLWEGSHAAHCASSIVEIWLLSYSSRCSLKLRHSGFFTLAERDWHSRMWQCSLTRLCGMMEGSLSTAHS